MDHAELKRAILLTSLELGKELGEDGLTMRSIARRLGVSATALYQHFDSKSAIMDAIRVFGLTELHRELAPSYELSDPVERLRDQGVRYLGFARRNRWLYATLMEGDGADWGEHFAQEMEFLMQSTVKFATALEDGLASGRMRQDLDVAATPWMFWAGLHGLALLMTRGDQPQGGSTLLTGDFDQIGRDFVDSLVRGFLL